MQPISGPGPAPARSPALQPRLTLQVADPGLGPGLQQMPHEELRAKELSGDISPILGEADFMGGELAPLWGPRVKGMLARAFHKDPRVSPPT